MTLEDLLRDFRRAWDNHMGDVERYYDGAVDDCATDSFMERFCIIKSDSVMKPEVYANQRKLFLCEVMTMLFSHVGCEILCRIEGLCLMDNKRTNVTDAV